MIGRTVYPIEEAWGSSQYKTSGIMTFQGVCMPDTMAREGQDLR